MTGNSPKLPISDLPLSVRKVLSARNPAVAAALKKIPLPALIPLPCLYEEGVVESCKTCNGAKAELRHVRLCGHPTPSDPDREFCTRGVVSGKTQSCATCPDYTESGVLITGGVGDAIAVESTLTPDERGGLTNISYACPSGENIRDLFALLPNYPKATHRLMTTGGRTYYSKASVESTFGPFPKGVSDRSINIDFVKRRPYTGSSLLSHRLGGLPPGLPAGDFAVVFPRSVWGRWKDRDFDAADWETCLKALDAWGVPGVVLGGTLYDVPRDERLVDLQGRTTLAESVEVLKAAVGYLGIDSWPSVLAAKLFADDRLSVKTVSPHCLAWKHMYFAPRTSFAFLTPKLRIPT